MGLENIKFICLNNSTHISIPILNSLILVIAIILINLSLKNNSAKIASLSFLEQLQVLDSFLYYR